MFDGRPYDVYDAALTATVSDFPVSIQPFRDMVRAPHLALALPRMHLVLSRRAALRHAAQSERPKRGPMLCLSAGSKVGSDRSHLIMGV